MRWSQLFVPTLRDDPADAEAESHRLMLRAGLIRRLAAGLYSWLPLGLRTLRKAETIIREEMDRAGALELLLPAIQPAELWQESGRWDVFGPELLRPKDRHERDFIIQPTSEEVITDIARQELKSYRQMPKNFYHIQTKFRDERRPRFGVMRGREFTMKDGYSFHRTAEDLEMFYQECFAAYERIFARAGLPHTRSHLLRHTMASRLLAGGSSLKEVADVLRHRSLNTTLIYAKLDGRRLVEVALPWPGTAATATATATATGRLS